MVQIPVEALTLTGAPHATGQLKTRLDDWAYYHGRGLNVKNFGAKGDNSTDDADAIQRCFDAAFGPYSAPKGGAERLDPNQRTSVYFPPGIYKVGKPLTVRYVSGGLIHGAGSAQSILLYTGAVPNIDPTKQPPWYAYPKYLSFATPPVPVDPTNPDQSGIAGTLATCLMNTNGMGNAKIKGLTFQMQGWVETVPTGLKPHQATPRQTCCFNWDWMSEQYYTDTAVGGFRDQNNTSCTFEDCHFRDATYGLIAGSEQRGSQSDFCHFINCQFTNLAQGFTTCQGNALSHNFEGCTFTDIRSLIIESGALCNPSGSIVVCCGCNFINCQRVYVDFWGASIGLLGTYSEAPEFAVGLASYLGCRHEGPVSVIDPLSNPYQGSFTRGLTVANPIALDACYLKNSSVGNGHIYLRAGTRFGTSPTALPAAGLPVTGTLRQWVGDHPSTLTFAQLSAISSPGQGLKINLSDSNTAAYGATPSGTGSNHVTVISTGATARGSVTFSAQPANLSTLTFGVYVYTLKDPPVNPALGEIDRGSSLLQCLNNIALFALQTGLGREPTGLYVTVSGGNRLNLVANTYGAAANGAIAISNSTSPNANVSAIVPMAGGTGPTWVVMSK